MDLEALTGQDVVTVAAVTLDAAIQAYPEMVVPDETKPANDPDAPGIFALRVISVDVDQRALIVGSGTVDVELTDRDGVARTFRLTLTATELRSL